MTLSHAWALWILGPAWVALAVAWVVLARLERRGARSSSPALGYPSLAAASGVRPSWRARLRPVAQALRLVTLGLLVLAMARPQTVRGIRPRSSEGVDIVLAIDTSGSMRALDLDRDKRIPERRTRLEVVKAVVADFVKKRPSDELGLVVFGAEAFLQCPLTLDHGLVMRLLDRLEIGRAGDRTAIGSGLGVAVARLKDAPARSKVVVLLTDGVNNTGPIEPAKAAEIARALGVRVYTIAAGGRAPAPIMVDRGLFGQTIDYMQESLDEESLRSIAETTGGAYFRAEDSASLAAIYDRIDALEKTELRTPAIVDYDEQAGWLVAPALAVLLAEVILLGTALRRVP